MTYSSGRSRRASKTRAYRSSTRPALAANSGSRRKIHDRVCHGLIASSRSQRQIVVADASVTPRSMTSRCSSVREKRPSGSPCVAGNSHAIALTSATCCGGKTARGPTSTSSAPMRSLSCRRSGAATKRSRSGRAAPALVEFEYRRAGTLAYLAAWDVHHANLFDRVEPKTGIQPFGRLVEQVMTIEPYKSASRVFWVVDNGSSHAGKTSIARMQNTWNNARLIHLPIHASWLNQAELYFSILQRKALTPNDFVSLEALAERLLAFGEHYRQIARPFEWTFTRNDLDRVLARIADHEPHLQLAPNDQNLRTRLLAFGHGSAKDALRRRDQEGRRQLPDLRRDGPRVGRPLAGAHQGGGGARQRRAGQARSQGRRGDRRGGREGRGRRVR